MSKSDKRKENIKTFFSSYKFLYSLFGILLVIVLILGILIFNKSREVKKNTANLVFPLLDKGINNSLDIDLYELTLVDDYSFKVSNFRQENVCEKDIEYSITVSNDTNTSIKISLSDSDKNLMKDQKMTKIDGGKLVGNEKNYDIYHVSVLSLDNVKKGDKINIKINS